MSLVLTVPVGCQAGNDVSAGQTESAQEDLVVPKSQDGPVPCRRQKKGILLRRYRRRMFSNCSFPTIRTDLQVEVKANAGYSGTSRISG